MRGLEKEPLTAEKVFVILCSIFISSAMLAIAGMLSAAFAFTNATTIRLPFVATFEGLIEVSGSNAVVIDVTWIGVLLLILLVSAPICIFSLRQRGKDKMNSTNPVVMG